MLVVFPVKLSSGNRNILGRENVATVETDTVKVSIDSIGILRDLYPSPIWLDDSAT